jgi:3-methylcrotonyl-CoA carboxylase alpha subunit
MTKRPFASVLIANRGEIAVRVIQACQEMGLRAVAVYSDADSRALHVQRADASYRIGPAPASESYLSVAALLEAARRSGAEAVHPGYGFLSENADFAQACLVAGLVFVGPPPSAIRAMGNKRAAKTLMEQAGVPTVPWSAVEPDDPEAGVKAERVGYPVLVKAAAGGGGRGMRVVQTPDELVAALEGARREAQSSFGDGSLLLERYVSPARHVEVQVFADREGNTVHLGERECSIQRRHQKVVEESPSPVVDAALRQALGESAVRAARAVGYEGAGTVEFVVDDQGRYFFLEMNTRIQVEHPVTEMVTGLDLVKLQLRVAAGEPLPFGQDDVRIEGHAIECRVVAEDPRRGFAPQSGRLTDFEPPQGAGIRNDVGTYPGDTIGVHYDALLAKLIVQGRSRAEAIERMRWALDEYQVGGIVTNLELLQFVIGHPEFAAGRTFTSFIADHWHPEADASELPLEALIAAVLFDLQRGGLLDGRGPSAADGVDPWAAAGPWRIGRTGMPFVFLSQGRRYDLTADSTDVPRRWHIRRVGETIELDVEPLGPGRFMLRREERTTVVGAVEIPGSSSRLSVVVDGDAYSLERLAPPDAEAAQTVGGGVAEHGRIASPMPAKVVEVRVKEGDQVKPRQTLVVLESMKIEHLVEAPYAATVEAVHCRAGDVVAEGALLVELEAR